MLLLALGTTVMQNAVYGWDIIPYVGIAKSYTETDKTAIHKQVYAELKEKVDDKKFYNLTRKSDYRTGVFNSPEGLKQQYPFYTVKPAYPALIYFFSEYFKVDAMDAAEWLAKIPMCFFLLLTFYWANRYLDAVTASLLTFGISVYAIQSYFAAWMTPDPLSGLLFFLICYLFIQGANKWLIVAIFPLLILTRPDLIMFAGLVLLCWFLLEKKWRIFAVTIVLALTAQYLTQSIMSGNYGWKVLFHHSFVEKLVTPEAFTPTLAFKDYVAVYLKQLYAKETTTFFFWCAVSFFTSIRFFKTLGHTSALTQLSVINLVYMVVHWAVFPEQNFRLLFCSYVLVVFFAFLLVSNLLNDRVQQSAN
ncbi:MAG: hypothetical protein MI743_12505 [Sneathiellales bacterium]|nr:hypothetical protein [Sneathiellales bacterium]